VNRENEKYRQRKHFWFCEFSGGRTIEFKKERAAIKRYP